MKKSVQREIKLLSILSNTDKPAHTQFAQGHPNIMKLYDAIDTPKQLYLILENVSGRMLHQVLKDAKNNRLSELACAKIFK